ncbi:MAG: HD domain-containing protein, partial [bacterium]
TGRFGTGKYSVSGYERMSEWVRTQLRGTLRSTMPRCEFLAGAGGGFASSESMAQAVGYCRKIPRSELSRQIRKLRGMTIDERCRVPGLESKRADIIVPSLCVIHELMKFIGAAHFVNYGDGVRDGMLVEAFEGPEVECQDIVGSSAELAARAPKVLKHAQQVRFLAIKMAAALESMDSRRFAFIGRRLPVLESAALLHDVGVSIDYSEHHQWSARIVSSEVFNSIDEHERAMVSELVRHHRRTPLDIKTARRVGFDASQARELVVLSNILRAADALDRSHRSRVQDIQMGRERGGAGWIRIRCRGRLNDELRALRKKGGALLSLIARDVRVEIR